MWEAQCTMSASEGVPPNTLFVADAARSEVLQWGHASKLVCHSCLSCTLHLLQQHFWWPIMNRDTKAYIAACPVCAHGKSSHQPPAGLLHPLLVPQHPWSHIAMDFVTGLPPSDGHMVILTIVDRFFKAAHFVPLSKLPTAAETGKLLVRHIFHLPKDIVFDRGERFTSRVWQSFCEALRATARLSSRYQPTNRQNELIKVWRTL